MKVLVLIDKVNWAYHSIAKALEKYNDNPDVSLSVMPIKGNVNNIKKKYKKFDKFFIMGWQTYEHVDFLPKKQSLTGLHSFHSWDDKKTTPERDVSPPKKLIDFLSGFRGVNAVSQRLTNLFSKNGLKVFYTPNGVDTKLFICSRNPPIGNPITVGYSGSKAHDWRKGVSEFIIPSAKKCGANIKIAMLSSDSYVDLEQMYKFYNEIDCYICASSSEGMSLSVLEAISCGRPVIGTKVSGNTEIIKDGVNGFLVDRSVSDICSKIEIMKNPETLSRMSACAAGDAKNNWCWSKQTKAWIDFIHSQ